MPEVRAERTSGLRPSNLNFGILLQKYPLLNRRGVGPQPRCDPKCRVEPTSEFRPSELRGTKSESSAFVEGGTSWNGTSVLRATELGVPSSGVPWNSELRGTDFGVPCFGVQTSGTDFGVPNIFKKSWKKRRTHNPEAGLSSQQERVSRG